MQRMLAIALGGAVGAVCRYAIVMTCMRYLGDRFPYGVLAANVVGCFLLGLLMHDSWAPGDRLSLAAHAAVTVGFLGALTTFSTFSYDTLRLLEIGRYGFAATNLLASCAFGLAACWLGAIVGNLASNS